MAVVIGKTEYLLGKQPVSGQGVSIVYGELAAAIEENVYDVLLDSEGTADIMKIIEITSDTGFSKKEIFAELAKPEEEFEGWRIGEALSESYLSEHKGGCFPWPNGRDIKKPRSSLPGADLIGFHISGESCCFLFGETKTSQDSNYPPSLMYGDRGFKQQLEDLCCNESLRRSLFKYLGYRAKSSPWESLFKIAANRFLHNSCDVHVFGMMIRDVIPNHKDLKARVKTLTEKCPTGMIIEMLAIYLPEGAISDLPRLINTEKERRAQYAE